MFDGDLARLYDVPTGALVQAVKRNRSRFPSDFFFQLTKQDVADLKSQSVISSLAGSRRWGGRRAAVNAFTEQGVAMLSSVLSSPRAISVNIPIMRTFVQLRSIGNHPGHPRARDASRVSPQKKNRLYHARLNGQLPARPLVYHS
jgi:hypothetical protein